MSWKRYPNHPLLVETHTYDPQQALSGKWVKKPILAREGANIRVLQDGYDQGAASGSFYFDDYDKYGYVVQKWVDTPLFSGNCLHSVYGWLDINVQACLFVKIATTLLVRCSFCSTLFCRVMFNRDLKSTV